MQDFEMRPGDVTLNDSDDSALILMSTSDYLTVNFHFPCHGMRQNMLELFQRPFLNTYFSKPP